MTFLPPQDMSPLILSLQAGVSATLLALLVAVPIAWLMRHRQGMAAAILDSLLLLPIALPPTVLGYLLLEAFGRTSVLGRFYENLTGSTIVFSLTANVIAASVMAFPLVYRSARAAFEQIDPTLSIAARTLGAGQLRVLLQVVLPLSRPGLIAAVLLGFTRALGEFGATLMLAGSIPGRTHTIPLAVFFELEAGRQEAVRFWVFTVIAIAFSVIAVLGLRTRPRRIIQRTDEDPGEEDAAAEFESAPPRSSGFSANIKCTLNDFVLDFSAKTESRRIGLLGASGSGKSLLLRCLAGVEPRCTGRFDLAGRTLQSERDNAPPNQRRVGMVFQNYALFPHLTVSGNVAFGIADLPRPARRARVASLLKLCGLSHLSQRYPNSLSGGQQQRVALARALAPEPELLLLDEPFSALDLPLRLTIVQRLHRILRGFSGSVIFVSHHFPEVAALTEEVFVLDRGRLIAHDTWRELQKKPRTIALARLLGVRNFARVEALDNGWAVPEWGIMLPPGALPIGTRRIGIHEDDLHIFQGEIQGVLMEATLLDQVPTPRMLRLLLRTRAGTLVHACTTNTEESLAGSDLVKVQIIPSRLICFEE